MQEGGGIHPILRDDSRRKEGRRARSGWKCFMLCIPATPHSHGGRHHRAWASRNISVLQSNIPNLSSTALPFLILKQEELTPAESSDWATPNHSLSSNQPLRVETYCASSITKRVFRAVDSHSGGFRDFKMQPAQLVQPASMQQEPGLQHGVGAGTCAW